MKSGLREQYVAFVKKFDDAMVKGDAVAAAALFTEDACFVDPTAGLIYGRKAGRLSRNSLQTGSRKHLSSAMLVRPISTPLIF